MLEIPNYRIVEKLGEGADSHIYRAREITSGQDYAVKIVKKTKPEDEGLIELMRTEHTIGTQIDHPNIRKIYELRYHRQRFRVRGAYLFMEYVPGITLSDKEFVRPLLEVLRHFQVACDALHAMHLAGFVHADLKPQNIILTPDDEVKLIDLGQSAKIGESKTRIQGTVDYMAPEQASGELLDSRTDVFGLGATLHKVLTGKSIPTAMNQNVSVHAQRLVGIRAEELKKETMEDLPIAVARLILGCCHPDPRSRVSTMVAMRERIEMVIQYLLKNEKKMADTLIDREGVRS